MTHDRVLICTIDDTWASAALVAALVAVRGPQGPTIALATASSRATALARLAKICARRGLAVEREGETIVIAGQRLAVAPEGAGERVRVREHRVEFVGPGGSARLGERAELLAAAPLLDAIERGGGLRWALMAAIEGSDGFTANIELCERRPDAGLDAGLQRCFPGLVGRVGFSSAVGPLPGAALHLTVLLGAGASVEGVRDLLAAQSHDPRSRWPRLRARPGFGSADCLGDPDVHLDTDAITSVGPLLRLVAYYDPPAILAGDLLRRLG
jgi:hypothetical protein